MASKKVFDWQTATDGEVLEEVQRIRKLYTLKHVVRYNSVRDDSVHAESVAEHIYGMFILADYFLIIESSAQELDRERVMSLILYHELGEIETGDIPTYQKTEADKAAEYEAAQRVLKDIPTKLQEKAAVLYDEYEELVTPESKFVKAIDKIEPIFEVFDDLGIETVKRLRVTYEEHVAAKHTVAQPYPAMLRFLEVLTNYLDSRGAFVHTEPMQM